MLCNRLVTGAFLGLVLLAASCSGDDDFQPAPDGAVSGEGGAPGCKNTCTEGARSCEGEGYKVCVKLPSGCTDWSELQKCPTDKVCSGGQCVSSCTNQCTENAVQCSGNGIQTCKMRPNGCTDWGVVDPCSSGEVCSGGKCVTSCTNQCTDGAKQCSGTGVATCLKMPNGCTDWDKPVPCNSGEICSGGKCVNNCTNQCTLGAKQCSGTGVQTCVVLASGCTDWDTPVPCPTNEICSGGTCVQSCTDQCTKDAVQCSGNGVQTCKLMATGCYDWDTPVPCPTGQICSGGQCATQCTNQCTVGAKQCSGTGVETCKTMANGCTDWDTAVPCPTGQICSGGQCVTQCVNQCTDGAVQCSGNGVQTCTKLATGCTDWDTAVPCKTGEICSGGKCVTQCVNQCTDGAVQCSGTGVQTCKTMANGCTDWDTAVPCKTGEICSGGKCVLSCTNQCTLNATQCSGNGVQTCKTMPNSCTDWDTAVPCPTGQVCSGGTCVTQCTNQCTPGAVQCSGTGVQTCKVMANGCSDWDTAVPCPTGQTCSNGVCTGGTCTNQCTPGQLSCSGNSVIKCVLGASGCYEWDSGTACPTGETCSGGQCLQGSVTITTDTELCGNQSYAGAFIVQGGAKVTCKSGTLRVKAKTIYIDPSSSIEMSAVSTAAGGKQSSYCKYYASGAGGGGYGGSGGSGGVYRYTSNYYCTTCSGGAGGSTIGSLYDLFIEAGTMGGKGCTDGGNSTCDAWANGGKGGGAVELWATDKATIYGKILADGASGTGKTSSYGGGSGGGSGGGILVMAPEVDISSTAVISAKGGSGGAGYSTSCGGSTSVTNGGNGGNGRVKILYGDTYANTGAVSGAQSISWMPPTAITSATHPDSTLYYNDTFDQLTVSWTKPYPGAKGYWYKLDQDSKAQVTPGNGTFTSAFTMTFPASQLNKAGDWYFHVLTVHSNDQTSTVANRYLVRINSATHTITSSSHPDQNTWYSDPSKKTVTFAWSPPGGVPSGSFKGVWYKVDTAKDTPAPSKSNMAGWTFTQNAQVLLQKDYQGTLFKDWTYYFHLVSEDTMGNLTKAASTYRVQLGTEPTKLNFFGYVSDASTSAKLASVEIKLEPYGLTATSDANGYFIFNNVYEGPYALTAQKTGYKDASVQVNVNASSVPYNFTLSP